jgi:hypothetical protein
MMKSLKNIRTVMVAMLIASTVVMSTFAMSASATSASLSDPQVLQLRYDNVNAHATFVNGYMGDVMQMVPQASDLQTQVNTISSDVATLNGFVSSNDASGFNSYITGTITPAFQAAEAAIKNDRTQYKAWNVTNTTRQTLSTDYKNLQSQYESQVNSTNAQLASLLLSDRINEYNTDIQNNGKIIANMSGNGFDVSGMQTVQGYAQAVVSKLQSVQGSDPKTIMAMLKSECLYNGATYSEHYAAEFDQARLQAVSEKLSPIVASSNNTAAQQAFATANSDLSSVTSTLQAVNHQTYTGDQQTEVWGTSGLQGASQNLKTVIDDLKSSNNQG